MWCWLRLLSLNLHSTLAGLTLPGLTDQSHLAVTPPSQTVVVVGNQDQGVGFTRGGGWTGLARSSRPWDRDRDRGRGWDRGWAWGRGWC